MSNAKGPATAIVGGGVLGAATLWELAQRGVPAQLLEAGDFGAGSTGQSAAIVRVHYSNAVVVRMALRAREAFGSFAEMLDCDPVYTRAGQLFLVDETGRPFAEANRAMQLAEGADSLEVDPAELHEYVPGIRTDGIAYALFEEESGYVDPLAATRAYIDAAVRKGARAYPHTQVESLELSGSKVIGLRVAGELVECDHVVLAAGAWSKRLAAGIGLTLPMQITREQDAVYETDSRFLPIPAISDQAARIYMRPFDSGGRSFLLVGRGFPKTYEVVDPDAWRKTIDVSHEKDLRHRLRSRLPGLKRLRMAESRVGLYSAPPDWHPLLGPVDGLDGLTLATGGSGHCFKLAPAIGEMIAASIVGERIGYADIDLFSLRRFAEGSTFSSTFGGNRA